MSCSLMSSDVLESESRICKRWRLQRTRERCRKWDPRVDREYEWRLGHRTQRVQRIVGACHHQRRLIISDNLVLRNTQCD